MSNQNVSIVKIIIFDIDRLDTYSNTSIVEIFEWISFSILCYAMVND